MSDIIPTWGSGLAQVTQKEMLARRFAMMPRKTWLYRYGDECVDVTGGWQSRGWRDTGYQHNSAPRITRNATNMTIAFPTGTNADSGVVETTQDVDVTKYEKLFVHCVSIEGNMGSTTRNYQQIYLACNNRAGTYSVENNPTAQQVFIKRQAESPYKVENMTFELDISAETGLRDISIVLTNWRDYVGVGTIVVDKIWLE